MPITTLTPNPFRYKEGAVGHSAGFQAVGYDDSTWAEGDQAFGKNDLSYDGPIATPWPGTLDEMCVRGHFSVPVDVSAVRVKVRIDLNGTVYINGSSIGTVVAEDNPYKTFTLSTWDVGDNLIAIRGYADEQQNRIAVLVELVYPGEAEEWDIFAASDLNGPLIATLENAKDRLIRIEEDGAGVGGFTINRHSPEATAAILAKGNLVRVKIPEISDDYIGAFFLETGDFAVLSGDEEGGEELTFGGKGSFSYLGRARMWNVAYSTGLDISNVWTEIWQTGKIPNPVGACLLDGDPTYLYVISGTTRRIYKLRQSDRVIVGRSEPLWAGSDNYAGGLCADPSSSTRLWALESPWAFGGSGNTKIRRIDASGAISGWNVDSTFDLGSATKLTDVECSSGNLWTTKYDGPDLQKRSKTTGAVVTSYSIVYGGVAQVQATGASINGSEIALWFSGKRRALIADLSDPETITRKISTTGISAFGGAWTTESGEDYFYPVSYTADLVWKYQLTTATPHDPVDGIWRLDEGTPGAIASRIVVEATHPSRPQHPVPDLTYAFTPTLDTDGNAWDSHPGTVEFTANVGDFVDETLLRLVPYGVTFQMDPNTLELRAYNEADFGVDRTSATFAAGKVRVAAGTSAAEKLGRRMDDRKVDSHLLVLGDAGRSAVSIDNDLGYVREGFLSTDIGDVGALEGTGDAELARQRRDSDAQAVVIPWPKSGESPGAAELAGRYLPGPAGSNGHYWVGDTIRVHSGTGNFDLNEVDRDVKAITISELDNGEWQAVADLSAVFIPIYDPAAPKPSSGTTDIGGTSGAGSTTTTVSRPITVKDSTNGESYTGTIIESDDWGVFQAGTGRVGVSIRGRSIREATDAELDAIADGQGIAWDDALEAWVPVDLDSGLGWFNVLDYGADPTGVADSTQAVRDAIAAAYAFGGGVIYFPPGLYTIAGALQSTGTINAQIPLPTIAHSGVDHIILTFRGALRPGFHPLYGDTVPLAAGLSVIKSTLTGASGTAAVFSAGNDISAGTGGNNLEVNVRDLVCLGPDDPTFTFWNLQAGQGGEIRGLQISTPGAYVGTPTFPTHSNAYGIKLPVALFSNSTKIDGLAAGGFYTGIQWGELAVSTGPLILGPLYYGIEIPVSYYPGFIVQLTATSVVRVLRPTGAASGHKATHGLDILQYVRERPGSGSFDTEFDLYDPSDLGSGYIRWYTITAGGGGAVDVFLRSGGANVVDQQIGGAWGGVTVQDEGVSLATLGTVLNFVGSGVAVTGTGATKTVTIAGGGSTIWKPVMDGLGNVVTDSGTGEAIMAEVAP